MLTKTTITAGVGFDGEGKPLENLDESLAIIRANMATIYGGYTETQGTGGWVNESGELVVEPCLVWTLYGDSENMGLALYQARTIAQGIRAMLRQYAVVASVEEVQHSMVTGEVTALAVQE